MAYQTANGFISAPQSLRRTMLASIHGPTLVQWLREASEQWNAGAPEALADTLASYSDSSPGYAAVPAQVGNLISRLEPKEAGFLLAAIHMSFSDDSDLKVEAPEVIQAESVSDTVQVLTIKDLTQLVLDVRHAMTTRSVLKALTITAKPSELATVERISKIQQVFQTYLETMNRYGITPYYVEFEKALESEGAPIPERSRGLNSLDYLMTT